jgi:hypothetical protein
MPHESSYLNLNAESERHQSLLQTLTETLTTTAAADPAVLPRLVVDLETVEERMRGLVRTILMCRGRQRRELAALREQFLKETDPEVRGHLQRFITPLQGEIEQHTVDVKAVSKALKKARRAHLAAFLRFDLILETDPHNGEDA